MGEPSNDSTLSILKGEASIKSGLQNRGRQGQSPCVHEPGESEGPAIADAVAIYWKNVGINAEVEMHDWAKIRTMFRKKTIHCCVWPNIIGWRPSDQGVRNFYVPAGNNHHFENEFLLKTFTEVAQSADAAHRAKLLQSIGDHLQEEFADIPLFWFRNEVFATARSSVTGLASPPRGSFVAFRGRSSSSSKRKRLERGEAVLPLEPVQARCLTTSKGLALCSPILEGAG